jgi:hypothetical protein
MSDRQKIITTVMTAGRNAQQTRVSLTDPVFVFSAMNKQRQIWLNWPNTGVARTKKIVNATTTTGQWVGTLEWQDQSRTQKATMHAGLIQKDMHVANLSAHHV